MSKGIVRLWIALSAVWILYSAWLCIPASQISHYSLYEGEMFILSNATLPEDQKLEHLPTIEEVKTRYASATRDNSFFLWEAYWNRISLGLFPDVYLRPVDPEHCDFILYRNGGGSVARYWTTCNLVPNYIGMAVFIFLPILLIEIIMIAIAWVRSGFIQELSRS